MQMYTIHDLQILQILQMKSSMNIILTMTIMSIISMKCNDVYKMYWYKCYCLNLDLFIQFDIFTDNIGK